MEEFLLSIKLLWRRLTCVLRGHHDEKDAQLVWKLAGFETRYCWRCFRQFSRGKEPSFMPGPWMVQHGLFYVPLSPWKKWSMTILVAVGTIVLVFLSIKG